MVPSTFTFSELLAEMEGIAVKAHKPYSGALRLMTEHPELRDETEKKLKALGIECFTVIACGKDAFVAKISDRQVIRISARIDVEPLNAPYVLQPVVSNVIRSADGKEGLRIEVLPLLTERNITEEHKRALCIAVSKRGFYFTDPKLNLSGPADQNVMLLKDGTPVIVDREAASYTTDDPFIHMEREGFIGLPAPAYVWEGKQERFHPEVKTGEVIADSPTSFVARVQAKESDAAIKL